MTRVFRPIVRKSPPQPLRTVTTDYLDRVPEPLRAAVERRGFTQLSAVQEAALNTLGEDKDLQISSQTGSGKTVALGLIAATSLLDPQAASVRGPVVLVIVPTRELAAQVRSELDWLYADVPSITLECVTGGTSTGFERQRLARHPRVVVGTPGRLLDHLRSGALGLGDIKQLVLDEADQMLDMGFREDLEAILESTPKERRTHLVSATFPTGILRLAERYQVNPVHVEGTQLGVANEDIEHQAYRVSERDRYAALVNLLLLAGGDRTLVFVNTRAGCAELAEMLSRDGFSAQPLSGELVQAQRTRTLEAFKNGRVSILVATDVASRGLDLPDVSTVIHAAPGLDAEIYTHRSGRTGRAGRKGRSILLVQPRKETRVRRFLSEAGVQAQWLPVPKPEKISKMLAKRARKATWAALDKAPEPSAERVSEAERLLEGKEPAQVLAAMLELHRPRGGPQPRELGTAPVESEARGNYRGQERNNGRNQGRGNYKGAGSHQGAGYQRSGYQGGGYQGGKGRPDHRQSDHRQSGGQDRARFSDNTSFHINWGFAAGATPKRILAHICRRGGIEGREVGAIRLQAHDATFEVGANVAQSFENAVRGRDSRDPHLRIQRAWQKGGSQGKVLARA